MKNMDGQNVIRHKKAPIKTYIVTTVAAAAAVFSMWFMKGCGNESATVIDKAKAPCGCNETPRADTTRVAGPRRGPFGLWKGRDTLHILPLCEKNTTKCPDSNAHRDSTGDCKCDSGYHKDPAKLPDLNCVKDKKTIAPISHTIVIPPAPLPCDCPPGLIEMPQANGVRESIESSMQVATLRKALVHDDKGRVPVIRVALPVGPKGGVQAPPRFEANCPDGCDTTIDLATVIPTSVVGRATEGPENNQPCTARFKVPLYP